MPSSIHLNDTSNGRRERFSLLLILLKKKKRVQGRTEYMKQILPAVPPRQVFTT